MSVTTTPISSENDPVSCVETKIHQLIASMSLTEKLGQLAQVSGGEGHIPDRLADRIRAGEVGSVINEVCPYTVRELQRIARDESRLGIPLLIGRDVIHGFHTVFPIPLGQAASWSEELVEKCARLSAIEASGVGVNWTFAPMIDICRDPRWGRIAESLGEDPHLCGKLGQSMIRGFQGDDLNSPSSIAACAKHFAGYGASESGRDYNTTNIPENELRNVHLPPFHRAVEASVVSFMSGFNDLNGVPATGNAWLLSDVLREEWQFAGFVVSDWESVSQLCIHGFSADHQDAALRAFDAGVDMEMVSECYQAHLPSLIDAQTISEAQLDKAVKRILKAKFDLGLFAEKASDNPSGYELTEHLEVAKEAAVQSCVLLKNHDNALPLNRSDVASLAVIGPLADDGYEQLGTWIFDGDERRSVTCLSAIRDALPTETHVTYVRGLPTTRSQDCTEFTVAIEAAKNADAVVMVLGEESILSGEAHCRTELDLPGAQSELLAAMAQTATPVILVIMAGRPLTLENVLPYASAVLFAWHPGSMGGPAICDLLFGEAVPSGKLPVTFPRRVGQIPIYHAQKHTGKPALEENFIHMDEIPVKMPQTSLGMAATHLDCHFTPQFPFGFGLSYSQFDYADIRISQPSIGRGSTLTVSAQLTNSGNFEATEIVQLYIRDKVGSVTRPVKELKGFQRHRLLPGESKRVEFELSEQDLSFYNRKMQWGAEAGHFQAWIGGDADAQLSVDFELVDGN